VVLVGTVVTKPFGGLSSGLLLESLQAISKNGIWFKINEEVKSQPEEYMKYFEDWLFTSDAEIGL
jgi:hypothetical protein